jgi:thiol-disulfide isomerase/thioredoxin
MEWSSPGFTERSYTRVLRVPFELPCRCTPVLAVLVLVFPLAGAAQTPAKPRIDWKTSYAEALALAKNEEKPLLIDFFATWCGPCHLMDEQTFSDPAVAKAMADFVCVKIDVDADEKTAFAYGIRSIPRTVILNVYGEIVGDRIGFMESSAYIDFLNDAREYTHRKMDGVVIGVPAEAPEAMPITPDAKLEEVMSLLANPDKAVRDKAREVLLTLDVHLVKSWMRQALASPYLGERIAARETLAKLDPSAWPEFDPWASAEERAQALAIGD